MTGIPAMTGMPVITGIPAPGTGSSVFICHWCRYQKVLESYWDRRQEGTSNTNTGVRSTIRVLLYCYYYYYVGLVLLTVVVVVDN
jgi:hypothetical protein